MSKEKPGDEELQQQDPTGKTVTDQNDHDEKPRPPNRKTEDGHQIETMASGRAVPATSHSNTHRDMETAVPPTPGSTATSAWEVIQARERHAQRSQEQGAAPTPAPEAHHADYEVSLSTSEADSNDAEMQETHHDEQEPELSLEKSRSSDSDADGGKSSESSSGRHSQSATSVIQSLSFDSLDSLRDVPDRHDEDSRPTRRRRVRKGLSDDDL